MNEGCRRPSALREIIARHGVRRPRVFGGAAQRNRSRMGTRGGGRPGVSGGGGEGESR